MSVDGGPTGPGMVERVARVLEPDSWGKLDKAVLDKGWSLEYREKFIAAVPILSGSLMKARAAIEAMREPTQAMIDACDLDIPTEGMITGVWDAMIDAALKEKSP